MAKKSNKSDGLNKLISTINLERKKMLNLRFQKATGQLEKTAQINKTKKQIAKIITQINQKKV